MRILVSVRDVDEALAVAAAGVHFIDLKEPRHGALGALPLPMVRAIVAALLERGCTQPVSATIGDLPMGRSAAILSTVHALAGCGVHYVKVGIERSGGLEVLDALTSCGAPIVPVLIADRGIDFSLVAAACAGPFPALMLDTADKRAGSLLLRVGQPELRAFVAHARQAGKLAGLAGSLQAGDLCALAELAPDFAGFRSALCATDRSGALDPGRLHALMGSAAVREHNLRQPTKELS